MGTSDPSILAVRAALRGGDVVTQARAIAAQAERIDELKAARDTAERDASHARADRRDLLATYRDLTEAR